MKYNASHQVLPNTVPATGTSQYSDSHRVPPNTVGERRTADPAGTKRPCANKSGKVSLFIKKAVGISVNEKQRQTNPGKKPHLGRLCMGSRGREGRQEKSRREGNMPRYYGDGKINTFGKELP